MMKTTVIGAAALMMSWALFGVPCGSLSGAESPYLDAVHAGKGVDCGGCHENAQPPAGAEVENKKCLGCHGTTEALAARTAPKQFPDRNPHESHLGEIGCTVCHRGHTASEVYCLGCHKNFQMKMPGAGS